MRNGHYDDRNAGPRWWTAGLLVVLMLPTQIWLGEPLWTAEPDTLPGLLGLAAAHVVATGIAPVLARRLRWPLLGPALAVAAAFGGAYAILVHGLGLELSRGVAGIAAALSLALVGAGLFAPRIARAVGAAALLATVAAPFLWERGADAAERPAFESRVRSLAYHRVRIEYHNGLVPDGAGRRGGGLRRVGDAHVRMSGAGAFYSLRRADGSTSILADSLTIPSPLDAAAFDSAGAGDRRTFRALDFVVRERDDGLQLIASHHVFHPERSCFAVRISAIDLDSQFRPRHAAAPRWNTLYETRPCLPVADPASRRPPGIQIESGGRMEWLAPGRLLVTVGDYGFDGVNHVLVASQAEDSDYGRTLLLDLATGRAEAFTIGQRNPQGLYVDEQGRIWSTEHGPQGGDELNLLVQGGNYGWPYQTDGADYGTRSWPLLDEDRGDFTRPAYAWVPSIGVSEVMAVPPGSLDRWTGDLLVGSLAARTLFRVRLAGTRVVHVEPIPIGLRIRDIAPGPDGSIWLWADPGTLVILSPIRDADLGERVFAQCVACHQIYDSGGRGPGLGGVFGRRIASLPDFDYSPALRQLGGTWTAERLDRFLEDPNAFAPGTTMTFPGVKDSAQRAALIDYLRQARAPAP